MTGRPLWKPLPSFQFDPEISSGIASQKDFYRLIHYERDRADRTGSRFTLVMIKLSRSALSPFGMRRYIASIVMQTRNTDHIGWFGRYQLGIILTDTTVSGAQSFLRSIHSKICSFGITSAIEVVMYPRVTNLRLFVPDADNSDEELCYSTYEESIAIVLRASIPKWKRILDIMGCLFGILLFSPVFILVPLYIRIVSPGPVIFRQKRVGLGGKIFDFLKFRTMRVENETSSHNKYLEQLIKSGQSMQKLDERDPRIIPGASLIRALGFDELPQLFNILRGEMSLVGPRPCIPYEADIFLYWHRKRFDILPGLTGMWQVGGKNELSFQEMIRLDIQYSESLSLGLDLLIIIKTIPTMVWSLLRSLKRKLLRKRNVAVGETPTENPTAVPE